MNRINSKLIKETCDIAETMLLMRFEQENDFLSLFDCDEEFVREEKVVTLDELTKDEMKINEIGDLIESKKIPYSKKIICANNLAKYVTILTDRKTLNNHTLAYRYANYAARAAAKATSDYDENLSEGHHLESTACASIRHSLTAVYYADNTALKENAIDELNKLLKQDILL